VPNTWNGAGNLASAAKALPVLLWQARQ